ncbi:hypothetical protein CLV24_105201 [Pontibacter ummariensis]|uniref:Uncharacterized protein n=1 Tax=Pontibacter ummariensis TaxID=1610492 RepID=A0A239DNK7_9BACT|nr:hypothetical protein [Pontibacter ummariensis]PRY13831.1 hypothetical protein CLV24_105201 [Pontibacter ummariensis]SNS34060.1 hypothetical protein SAMN06296052_10551 [Pontibacter ummariensis]
MEFKTYREEALYCYLSAVSPPFVQNVPRDDSRGSSGDSRKKLEQYLSKAADLSEGKNLWVMIRETPESARQFGHLQPLRIAWKYDVVANDIEGVGIDKGFVPVEAPYSPLHGEQGQASLLFQVPDLMLLLRLTEDALGDVDSHVTVLALQQEEETFKEVLMGSRAPQLPAMLGDGDLFINIAVGKEQGYYDTFLLKARSNMENPLLSLTS